MARVAPILEFLEDRPPVEKTICFTGPRPHKAAVNWVVVERWIIQKVHLLYDQGSYRGFISGGARGFDWMAAKAVLLLKDTRPDAWLTMALPFKGYNASWPKYVQDQFEREVLDLADEILYLFPPPHYSWKYVERDRMMVDHSSHVIAMWKEGYQGGTDITYQYALQQNKSTETWWP